MDLCKMQIYLLSINYFYNSSPLLAITFLYQ